MDYINTSHPAFLGGSKAVEVALQYQRSSKVSTPSYNIKAKVNAHYLSILSGLEYASLRIVHSSSEILELTTIS